MKPYEHLVISANHFHTQWFRKTIPIFAHSILFRRTVTMYLNERYQLGQENVIDDECYFLYLNRYSKSIQKYHHSLYDEYLEFSEIAKQALDSYLRSLSEFIPYFSGGVRRVLRISCIGVDFEAEIAVIELVYYD